MLTFLFWYIWITVIGLITFPLTFRLLPALSDRGYTLSRILGLLLWGYFFWVLASLGILRNDLGGLLLALIILIVLSYLAYRNIPAGEIRTWWDENRRLVLIVELIFLVAFAGWTIVRAANPEILGTEKPMELAFINAILRSPVFPPHDPWLSGYSISYYYFGYVMTAMLAKLTGTAGSVAFNLSIALIFALSATSAYGILFSLLKALKGKLSSSPSSANSQNLIVSLLGPFYILIVSNLEGFLEVLHARGLFWRPDEIGQLSSSFWQWLDLKELSLPPPQPLSWAPSRYFWWWRASRVVQDYDLAGNWREVIDEFPFFSYLLADLHPHVLVMPFALLTVGLTLNMFLGGGKGSTRWLVLKLAINPRTFWSSALIIGGLAFLNTWDFPIYIILFSFAHVVWWVSYKRGKMEPQGDKSHLETENVSERLSQISIRTIVGDFLGIALSLAITGFLLYLPFYIGFSSQASGLIPIIPNVIYSTRGVHLWIMFGSLLIPIFAYLFYLSKRRGGWVYFGRGLLLVLGLTISIWIVYLLVGYTIANTPLLGDTVANLLWGDSGQDLFMQAILRRITGSGWVTIVLLLGLTVGFLWPIIRSRKKTHNIHLNDASEQPNIRSAEVIISSAAKPHNYVLLLILIGGLLVIFPEFYYLRDQFGTRMNTIFKFYYQTWILWGLAAAFGTAVLLKELHHMWGIVFRIGLAILFITALAYPLLSLWNKTSGFNPPSGFTLDGTAYLERISRDDMEGIRWLTNVDLGVVTEAVGPQYSEYARVATLSGQPNVLGWPGHESQWRGGSEEIGNREQDVESIYRSNDWEYVSELLDRYDVRYIFIGPLERRSYQVNESKFMRFLGEPVFQFGEVSIYEVPKDIYLSR
jgi:YYY domain-containing protein